ncbi:MAG: hypothetical protein PHV34_20520 [Verrucomicrobiae bacterium]|nr:hypothetical protein [Verrucomicrobiae bacterium]
MKLNKFLPQHHALRILQTFDVDDNHRDFSGEASFSSPPGRGAKKMQVVCAWCHDVIQPGDVSHGISHGICMRCSTKMQPEMEALQARYVE